MSKLTELDKATSATADDILYIVNDPEGTPSSLQISIKALLESNVSSNVAINGSFDLNGVLSANAVSTNYRITPANSSSVPVGLSDGDMWSDGSYLYIVSGSIVKRATLSTW